MSPVCPILYSLQVYSYLLFPTKTKLDDSFPYFHFHIDDCRFLRKDSNILREDLCLYMNKDTIFKQVGNELLTV